MTPTFVELFAGVGGMALGLERVGWRCVGHAEWEPFQRRVLRHRWPDVPLWGDVTALTGRAIEQEVGTFDLLTFGAPCQDFSLAGTRVGLDGDRSVTVFDALRIWRETAAPYALYENVTGMLSSNDGRDFADVLSAFTGGTVAVPPDGWRNGGVARGSAGIAAWRTLDAQYFGWEQYTIPQRRRRVFVLGTRTTRVDPFQVLSLGDSLSRHLAPRHQARQSSAAAARRSDPTALVYDARGNGHGTVVNTLTGDHERRVTDYTAIVARMVALGVYATDGTASTLKHRDEKSATDLVLDPALTPRRLTPTECERLMGWPDGWTDVPNAKGKPAPDYLRYQAIGNGVSAPVAAWIGLQLLNDLRYATP